MTRFARTFSVLLVFALLLSACQPISAPEDRSQIYAAVIRQVSLDDNMMGGDVDPEVIFVLGSTNEYSFVEKPDSVIIPADIRDETSMLLTSLPAELIWIETWEEAIDPDTGTVFGGDAVISLGNIRPQADGSVHVNGNIFLSRMAQSGTFYVLKRIDGAWRITGSVGGWIP